MDVSAIISHQAIRIDLWWYTLCLKVCYYVVHVSLVEDLLLQLDLMNVALKARSDTFELFPVPSSILIIFTTFRAFLSLLCRVALIKAILLHE